jgi:diguanylate cyclase (GGDEF)-like protein
LVPGNATKRSQERALECLETLGVGLAVWDEQGQRLLWNQVNDRLQEHAAPPNESVQQGKVEAPHLERLEGNRWVVVYEARSAAGYKSMARVDVTNLVKRSKELEDRVCRLAWESSTDALTGLANRRHFDAALAVEWNRAARTQSPLSLLMIDIDHFKKYNDHYGHLTGDHCIQRVAATLQGCARRAGDLVARFGGEEFVLLLPGVDIDEARETAQQCVDRMRKAALPHVASPVAAVVTLSIGIASRMPEAMASASCLINAADAAMYRAKSAGRARYEVASQLDWDIADETPRTQPAVLALANDLPESGCIDSSQNYQVQSA